MRKRVIEFVRGGGSKREAARRFGVGEASVYRWVTIGERVSLKPGPRGPHKLDMDALAKQVREHSDWTQHERAHHFGVTQACICFALRRLKVSRKKNDVVHATRHYEKKGISASS